MGYGRWGSDMFGDGMKKLRTSGLPTDFTLVVDGQEFPLHKVVMFCHSDVLFKMSTNPAFVECQTGRAELKDVQALHVQHIVEYMYNEHYIFEQPDTGSDSGSGTSTESIDSDASIDFDMAMMILAEQYNVTGLGNYAEDRIRRALEDSFESAVRFAKFVEKIYDNEDLPASVLRLAIQMASEHIELLHSEENPTDNSWSNTSSIHMGEVSW